MGAPRYVIGGQNFHKAPLIALRNFQPLVSNKKIITSF